MQQRKSAEASDVCMIYTTLLGGSYRLNRWYQCIKNLEYSRNQKVVGVKFGDLRGHKNPLSSSIPVSPNHRTRFMRPEAVKGYFPVLKLFRVCNLREAMVADSWFT